MYERSFSVTIRSLWAVSVASRCCRALLFDLGPDAGEFGVKLIEVALQNRHFPLTNVGWNILAPGDCGGGGRWRHVGKINGSSERDRCLAARDLGDGRGEIGFGPSHHGAGFSRIQFHEHLPGRHLGAIGDANRHHLTSLEGLEDLRSSRRLNLPLRGRNDVDPPNVGPGKGDEHEGTDDQDKAHAHRRGRRLEDLECRGQKLEVGALRSERFRWNGTRSGAKRTCHVTSHA
jgi:hypothetical protein